MGTDTVERFIGFSAAGKMPNNNSQHEELQKALEEAHALIQTLFNSMPIGILLCDSNGNIQASNKSTEELFSRSSRDLSKLNFKTLLRQDSIDIRIWIEGAIGKTTNIDGIKSNDETVPLDATVELIGGNPERVLICLYDVSERHRLEQLKRDFVAMISHDLRTPLTSVQAFLDGLAAGMYDDQLHQAKRRAQNIEADVARLINLVSSLLDIEKMEAGKLTIDPEVFPVERLLDRSVESVRALSERSQIKLQVRRSDCFIYADENQLVQVLVNLLSNAIKFSPKGESVSLTANELENWVEIKVSDNGRGIPESHRAKIFDRFEQVELSDASLKGGTGLGLAICKTIVAAHKGEIGVESEQGKGSTFWLRIPLNR